MTSISKAVREAVLRSVLKRVAAKSLAFVPQPPFGERDYLRSEADLGHGEVAALQVGRTTDIQSRLSITEPSPRSGAAAPFIVIEATTWRDEVRVEICGPCMATSPLASLPEFASWLQSLCAAARSADGQDLHFLCPAASDAA